MKSVKSLTWLVLLLDRLSTSLWGAFPLQSSVPNSKNSKETLLTFWGLIIHTDGGLRLAFPVRWLGSWELKIVATYETPGHNRHILDAAFRFLRRLLLAGVDGGHGHRRRNLAFHVVLFAELALRVGHVFECRLAFISDDLVWGSLQEGLHPILRPEAWTIGLGLVVLKIVAGLLIEKRLFRIQLL